MLYIEKEGFGPLLEEARIAERFDIAILSGKGQSTAAARRFVDEVCRLLGGVPLFILRDFDKAGFQIAKRLTTVGAWAEESDMVLYEFKNEINVTDLGLRLADVDEYDLHDAAEDVPCTGYRCKCFECQPLDRRSTALPMRSTSSWKVASGSSSTRSPARSSSSSLKASSSRTA